MGFYKDEKTHVYPINADTKTPRVKPKAPADLEAAFAAGAMSGKGRGGASEPVQVSVTVATGKKRPR